MKAKLDPHVLMAKAERACQSARALYDLGDMDGACNRAYYAMFDAARSALIAQGTPVAADIGQTHNGLITAFGLHLVKQGPVPKDIGRLLKRAEEMRLIADYTGNSIEDEDAFAILEQAEIFVATLKALVKA